MDIEITDRREKALLGQEVIELAINHAGEATPTTVAVRKQLAAELDLDPLTIAVDGIHSASGRGAATARVTVHPEPIMDELPEETGDADEEEEADGEPDGDGAEDADEPGESEEEADADDAADEEDAGSGDDEAADADEPEDEDADEEADGEGQTADEDAAGEDEDAEEKD